MIQEAIDKLTSTAVGAARDAAIIKTAKAKEAESASKAKEAEAKAAQKAAAAEADKKAQSEVETIANKGLRRERKLVSEGEYLKDKKNFKANPKAYAERAEKYGRSLKGYEYAVTNPIMRYSLNESLSTEQRDAIAEKVREMRESSKRYYGIFEKANSIMEVSEDGKAEDER